MFRKWDEQMFYNDGLSTNEIDYFLKRQKVKGNANFWSINARVLPVFKTLSKTYNKHSGNKIESPCKTQYR